ncbi:MAG: GNAT family N-acetyltransferase [Chloroflexi bacterium]|nr:GNAT family N-acetyltransferase [Chloroflexota bacterium]
MKQTQPFLTRPQARYKDSFIEAVCEHIREKRAVVWHPEILRTRFQEYLRVIEQMETDPLAGYVPATRFWLVGASDCFIGDVDLRHYLNESLRRFGGHIGYNVRPSLRRRGYGTLICRLGIEEARKRGIGDILITCDDDNIGSAKIIEANGGVLRDRIDNGRGVLTRRYWIRAAC